MANQNQSHDTEVFPSDVKVNDGAIPFFLKLTYIGFVTFGITYWFLYNAGDGSPLVLLMNAATNH